MEGQTFDDVDMDGVDDVDDVDDVDSPEEEPLINTEEVPAENFFCLYNVFPGGCRKRFWSSEKHLEEEPREENNHNFEKPMDCWSSRCGIMLFVQQLIHRVSGFGFGKKNNKNFPPGTPRRQHLCRCSSFGL